jgi:D-ribose pyranose/furanose isomerase RbsD
MFEKLAKHIISQNCHKKKGGLGAGIPIPKKTIKFDHTINQGVNRVTQVDLIP